MLRYTLSFPPPNPHMSDSFSPGKRVSVIVMDATLVLGVAAWCKGANERDAAGEYINNPPQGINTS